MEKLGIEWWLEYFGVSVKTSHKKCVTGTVCHTFLLQFPVTPGCTAGVVQTSSGEHGGCSTFKSTVVCNLAASL